MEIQAANLNAISLWAKVPPYRPERDTSPIAPVVSIHFCGDKGKSVQPCFFSKPLEFEGFKIGVIQTLPNPKIFCGVAVSHPIADNGIRILRFETCNVGKRNVIDIVDFEYRYVGLFYVYLCHGVSVLRFYIAANMADFCEKVKVRAGLFFAAVLGNGWFGGAGDL